MAYYTNLINAWNGAMPAGVSGTTLSSGMTTDQKINAVNGWVMTGNRIPMIVPTYKIYNVIAATDFTTAVPANSQLLVRDILGMGTVDLSSGTVARSRLQSIFPSSTPTFQALASLSSGFDTPKIAWTTASSGAALQSAVSMNDCLAAGLT